MDLLLLPGFTIVPSSDLRQILPGVETDMLVLTKAATGKPLGPGPQAVDDAVGGMISERMRQEHFSGEVGSQLLFEFSDRPQRYILLVGLGAPLLFNQIVLGDVFRSVLDEVCRLKVQRISMPVVGLRKRLPGCPLRLPDIAEVIALETAKHRLVRKAGYPDVVELYCRRQADRHVRQGLTWAHERIRQKMESWLNNSKEHVSQAQLETLGVHLTIAEIDLTLSRVEPATRHVAASRTIVDSVGQTNVEPQALATLIILETALRHWQPRKPFAA